MSEYNALEKMEELMDNGYDEEHAEMVAVLSNYDIPLEEMGDIL